MVAKDSEGQLNRMGIDPTSISSAQELGQVGRGV